MKIPNSENAIVQIEKIRDYCLNEEHPRGKHKARVFKARLGLERKHADMVKTIILDLIKKNEAKKTSKDEFGVRYCSDLEIKINNKRAVIRTFWIIRTEETFPRFTSCYIKRK